MTSSVKVNVENIIVLCTYMPKHVCAKFEGIWLSHFQVIVLTKKWLEIRKIKNNK